MSESEANNPRCIEESNDLHNLHEMEDRLAILIFESGCTIGHEAFSLCASNDRTEISLWALTKDARWSCTLRCVWQVVKKF